MILKGSSRRGAVDLALHLSNALDNERVVIHSVRGAVSENLYDAFREWELIADQSNAKNSFYSLSINPDPQQRDWSDKEWEQAIEHIEAKLGLTGQARAVVYHYKVGVSDGEERKHLHIVWSRIKIKDGQIRAISDSHDYYKLRDATKELAMKFNLNLRRGRRSQEAFDLAKSQGKNRDPETAKERKAVITKLWLEYNSAKAFEIAMNNAGYVVAQGDRRSFVILDQESQVHALARQIEGVKTKQVKERLGDCVDYPTIEQAKEEQRIRAQAVSLENTKKAYKRVDLTKEQKLMSKLRRMARRADQLKDKRRHDLKANLNTTTLRHEQEWEWQQRRFRAQTAKLVRKRELTKPKGIAKYFRTAIGYETLLRWKHTQQDRDRARAFEVERQRMKKAQAEELGRLERYKKTLMRIEKREAKSFERLAKKLSVRKEQLDKILVAERRWSKNIIMDFQLSL